MAAVAAGVLALAAGALTWAGAASQGGGISLARMLEAGANCLPPALLFLGISALAYAIVPRAASTIAYTLLAAAFLWYLLGDLLGVPRWLVDVTPFAHIGLVPTHPFDVAGAVAMVAIGSASAALATALFRRRDLVGM